MRTAIRSRRTAIALLSVVVAPLLSLSAQDTSTPNAAPQPARWELLMTSGRFMPTGSQREALEAGNHSGAQITFAPRRHLALHSTLGWTRSHDVRGETSAPRLDVVSLDVGGEWRAARWLTTEIVSVSPFAGAGAGARAFTGRTMDGDARTAPTAYASAGAEVGTRRVRVRIEARNYVSASPLGVGARGTDSRSAHNDVLALVGLRYSRR